MNYNQVLDIKNIGKAYKRYSCKWGRMAEWLNLGKHHELHWVLQNINFNLNCGEAVGIIGMNGAGKSTLLKIITGTTQPTTGTVETKGHIAALLELGMGFHPEFTGRENVNMAAQLRGIDNKEILDKMADIEDFAEIGSYIDQPVRIYSSGMQVRLAFSVATAIRPEILIVDEALSVGDIYFQQKCFDRIREFRSLGTTLLFVTHNMPIIYSLCDRAILLEAGQMLINGKPKEAIDLYQERLLIHQRKHPSSIIQEDDYSEIAEKAKIQSNGISKLNFETDLRDSGLDNENSESQNDYLMQRPISKQHTEDKSGSFNSSAIEIDSITIYSELAGETETIISEDNIRVDVTIIFREKFDDPHVGFQIRNYRGEPVFMTNTYCMHESIGFVDKGTEVTVTYSFKCSFAPGEYTITVGVANGGVMNSSFKQPLARKHNAIAFTVLPNIESIIWSGVYNISPKLLINRKYHYS